MTALPVLGPDGWATSAQKILDYAIAHMYACDASQTALFPGMVSSITKVIKDEQGVLERARGEIEDMITRYLGRYFAKVEVNVSIYDSEDFHRGELVLAAVVTDKFGERAQIHEIMTNKGSVSRSFLDYQNRES